MNHTALAPAGPFAERIVELFWLFGIVAAVVYLIVIGFLVYGLRGRREAEASAPVSPKTLRAIGAAVGLTGIVLVGLTISDFLGNRALAKVPADALHVRVTGHQWWWEIEYQDSIVARRVTTANQLALPLGRPVMLELGSGDVIHSFWVPSLQGKKDLLPGYTTTLALLASRAGDYTGECAEFCGYQHAHMSLDVAAVPPDEFARWLEAQRADAAEPATEAQRRGREIFLTSSCRACHAVQGTIAAARLGPDLTHVGSRPRIAAGALPNNLANMAAWIANPQAFKPGARMPATQLASDDLAALASWLGSLR